MGKSKPSHSEVVVAALASRPKPPAGMTDAEKEIWVNTLDALPFDFVLAESFPLLRLYCQHVATCEKLSRAIEVTNMMDFKGLERLLKLRTNESAKVMAAARALRLTNQSRFTAHQAASTANRHTAASLDFDDPDGLLAKPTGFERR